MEALLAVVAIFLVVTPTANFALFWVERRRRRRADAARDGTIERLTHRIRDLEARLDEAEAAARAPAAAIPPPPPEERGAERPAEGPPEEPLPTTAHAPPPEEGAPVPPRPPVSEPPPPTPSPAPPPPSPPRFTFDWESLVGVRLFSWMAGVTLLVAAVAFLRYSLEHGWLAPPVRMAMGLALGAGLLVGCETRRAQRYRPTALSLTAAGVATLFSTFYSAHALWRLLPALPTFALLALVTAVAVALSIRRDSIFIALLGLVGGFATPVLLSTGEDRPIGLFSYLALLDVGLAWVAFRKRWPLLAALSLGFTALYQLGWVVEFLEPAKLPIGVGIFLVFPLIGFAGLALGRRRSPLGDAEETFRWTAALGAVPPVLFAFHAAAAGSFGDQWPLLFGFLLLVAAGLAAVAALQGPEWLHLLGGAGTLAAVGGWVARSYVPDAWPGILAFLALLVGLYLGAPLLLSRLGRDFREDGRLGAYAAPLLLFAFAALAPRDAAAGPAPFLGSLLVLAAACAGFAIVRGAAPIHFVAAAAAILGEAIWSASHLSPERLLPALLAYAAFGLLFLGAPLLAERLGRPLRPAASASFLLLASLALLLLLAAGPVAHLALSGIAFLAALIEAGLLLEAARGRNPLLAIAGLVLGFAVLVIWWMTAMVAAVLLPLLFAVAALALVALGGSLLVARQREAVASADAKVAGLGGLVGIAGHGFLLAVATSLDLALPPWPWLAVLFLLDLAFLVGSLLRRDGTLVLGAVAGSVVVLIGFGGRIGGEACGVAALSAVGVAGIGLGAFLLAPRRGAEPRRFLPAAAVGLFGAQAVLFVVGNRLQVDLPALLAAHLLLLLGLLLLAWRSHAQGIALAASVSTFVAAAWVRFPEPPGDGRRLALVAPLYLLLLAYPLARGARARGERLPFVASIVASGLSFLLARDAIVALGGGGAIGLLPVTQAALLVPHLVQLLRMEPPSARDRGRLAAVAGAILAFVTVAIPLQLEKQWITLGWALLGAALAWLHRRLEHRGLLAWCAALFGAVFVRLALNPAIFRYQPRSETPIWNWYLYTYVVAAAAFFAASALLAPTDDRFLPRWAWLPRLSRLLPVPGTVLLFLLVNLEIADFFSEGPRIVFRFTAGLAPDLSYTIAWALFAILLLTAGVVLRAKPARVAAIALLAVTVLKGFLHDLSKLEGLYRVASFVGLAVSLALVAVVLQRFVLRLPGDRNERNA